MDTGDTVISNHRSDHNEIDAFSGIKTCDGRCTCFIDINGCTQALETYTSVVESLDAIYWDDENDFGYDAFKLYASVWKSGLIRIHCCFIYARIYFNFAVLCLTLNQFELLFISKIPDLLRSASSFHYRYRFSISP